MDSKRAWLYCRVAHPDLTALDMQKRCLLDYANGQGYTVMGATAEQGSGLDYSRKGFCEVLEAAEDGMVDIILIKNLSRLGRNTVKTDACIRWLKQRDVKVVCADGTEVQPSMEILAALLKASGISR